MASLNDNTPSANKRPSNLLWLAIIAVVIIAGLAFASRNQAQMAGDRVTPTDQTQQGYSGNTTHSGARVPSATTTAPVTPNNAVSGTTTEGTTAPTTNGSWGTDNATPATGNATDGNAAPAASPAQ